MPSRGGHFDIKQGVEALPMIQCSNLRGINKFPGRQTVKTAKNRNTKIITARLTLRRDKKLNVTST